jgi:hypothetical protein
MEKLVYEKPALKSLTGGEYLSFAAQCLATGTSASNSCGEGTTPESTCKGGTVAVGNCNAGGSTIAPSCGAGTSAT